MVGLIVRRYWGAFLAVAVILVLVFAGLMYSQSWSEVTLRIYNNLEEPVIVQIYVDGGNMNWAVEIGPNHTAFSDAGGGTWSPMGGFPGNVTLHAVMGTHEYGIDFCRYCEFNGTGGFRGDGIVDTSKSISVGFLSSQSVVLVVT